MKKLIIGVIILIILIITLIFITAPFLLGGCLRDCFGVSPENLLTGYGNMGRKSKLIIDSNSAVINGHVWFGANEEIKIKNLKSFATDVSFCFESQNSTIKVGSETIKNVKPVPFFANSCTGNGDNCVSFVAACSNNKENLIIKINKRDNPFAPYKEIIPTSLTNCICNKTICCAYIFIE